MIDKKDFELTYTEKEIKHYKTRYYELLLDKNSYLHDLHSPVSQISHGIKESYELKLKETEQYLENTIKKLNELGYTLFDGKWL